MNIANKLTLLRIVLVPIFVAIKYSTLPYSLPISGGLFIISSLTDFLDGYLARKNNLVTKFGKFADPLADKILVSAALICLTDFQMIPAWTAIIIIAREFTITGFRIIAASENITFAASPLGKIKTITQMISISWLLFAPYLSSLMGLVIFYISVIFTILSGMDYIWKNRKVLELENI